MATNIFQITRFSSFRWVNKDPELSERYHTLPFDSRVDEIGYFQKIEKNDPNFRTQIISDFVPAWKIYRVDYDKFVKNVDFESRKIKGASYMVYSAEVDFTDLIAGELYYGEITYQDENDDTQTWQSNIFLVDDFHEGTLFYEYTNTLNDKGVVFVNPDASLMVFGFRVEGNFDEYQPLSDDVEYVDQDRDTEVLNNTPYDQETNFIGTDHDTGGIPDWVIKKMNLIFSLNKVSIDGSYYAKVSGSKFKPTRPENQEVKPTFWQIDIIPNENFNLEQFITDDTENSDIVVIKKAKIYDNKAADFSVPGVFTVNSNLIRVAIENKGLDEFVMQLGTVENGDDIGTIVIQKNPENVDDDHPDGIVDLTSSNDIGHLFKEPTTVFISGIGGTNLKITLDYNQYDSPGSANPAVNATPWVRGTRYMYEELVAGDFALDWNIADGQGQRRYTGCVLQGTNGTEEVADLLMIAWNRVNITDRARGEVVGNAGNQITQTPGQVAKHSHLMFNGDTQGAGGNDLDDKTFARHERNANTNRDYNIAKSNSTPTRGRTSDNMKAGTLDPAEATEPMNIANRALVTCFFVCVNDGS